MNSMKKILAFFLVLVTVVTLITAASASSDVFSNGATARWAGALAGNNEWDPQPVTLKRGKTKEVWVACNRTELMDGTKDYVNHRISYFKLNKVSSKISVEVEPEVNWLKAEIKDEKLYLTVSGTNKKQETLNATVIVKDKKGTFGKVKVHRCGASKFTSIKQNGKKIELKIKYAEAANKDGYIRLTIFDKEGNVVEMDDDYPTNKVNLDGTKYVYDQTKLKKGYTYAFVIGYQPPHTNSANGAWVAAIRLKAAKGKQEGNVKCCIGHDYDNTFLYEAAQ